MAFTVRSFSRFPLFWAGCMGLWLLAGCGGAVEDGMAADVDTRTDALLAGNGLVTNGLVTNGLVTNGLVTNGLVTNGLNSSSFSDWFNANPATLSDMVMTYLVRCAVPNGQSRTWTNPQSGVTYTWWGQLGLTPSWASGNPANLTEQQLITGCLAAHVNKYGMHVVISLRGESATGQNIPVSASEASTYDVQEGCFFGNLFNGEGVYVGSAIAPFDPATSSVRTCALAPQTVNSSDECSPMVYIGSCANHCTLSVDGKTFQTCYYNGKAYKPLATAIRDSDVYHCGDGVCQFTESPGCGNTTDSCRADCGTGGQTCQSALPKPGVLGIL